MGLVDLGSNTARLVIYEYQRERWFQIVDSIREPVRLAEGFAESGVLASQAVERAIATLTLFADYANAAGLPPIVVYCTSAVREAANRAEFLSRIRDLGLPYSVLDGHQEARHGVRAVTNSLPVEDAWVVDLGGGSAQVSRVLQRSFIDGDAHPLGAVRTTERFLADGLDDDSVAALEAFTLEQLRPVLESMRQDSAPLVAMGGSIRSLAAAAQASRRYPYPQLHAYELTRSDFEAVTRRLLINSLAKRRRIAGISPDRADILPAAAIVFRTLMRAAERERIVISGTGVREGIFFETFLPAPHQLAELQDFAVSNAQRQTDRGEHVRRVRRLALALFDGLQRLHDLDESERQTLGAAAELHDIGTRVSFHRRHRHAAYLIDAAPLWGFDHQQQAMISRLVRFHRSGRPTLGPYRRMFGEDDERTLLILAACLRLAVQFERSRAGRVEGVSVQVGDRITVSLHAATEPTVELWEAGKHAGLVQTAFGRELVLGYRPEGGSAPEPDKIDGPQRIPPSAF